MRDLRVISAKAILPIHSVYPMKEFYPPSFMVLGTNLDKTEEVELNGVLVDEYAVLGPDRVLVRVPDSQMTKPLLSLRAYAAVSVVETNAAFQFAITKPPKTVEGLDRLVQSWLIVLMTTPGSDIFDKQSGGGARSLIGKTTDRSHSSIAADLSMAISRTNTEILRTQAANLGLPSSERLLAGSLDSLNFDESTSILNATVSLQNMAGQYAAVSLG